MNNKEVFIEKLKVCGEVKYEMSEVHNRILNGIKNLYQIAFKKDKKEFSNLKNAIFFRKGLELQDSKPKLHSKLDEIISLINHYELLENNRIKEYFEQHGIKIEVIVPEIEDKDLDISKEEKKKFEKTWNYTMVSEIAPEIPQTKKEFLKQILERSLNIQNVVEDKKEEIDKTAEEVDTECQIKKQHFMKALNIKLKELKMKSVDNELVRMETDIEASKDIISIFDTLRDNPEIEGQIQKEEDDGFEIEEEDVNENEIDEE